MTDQLIDLYSDTHSKPTAAMRRAMAEAEVGDEQQGADPTTNRLQDRAAELLGKEAALFLPSGTMCNQIAYRVWCQPGDEIILDKTGHTIHSETGGPAALSGAMVRPLDGERGIFTGRQVLDAVRPSSRHAPRSAVVSVENTCNGGGGSLWPIERVGEVTDAARDHGLKCHMDGARLLNAVVASGVSAADFAAPFDSCWIDLSKGLGCPVGAVLAGSRGFIDRAWRFKHQFGGAMRQSGIIAAAGLHALDHHVERLAEDHANARRFAALIAHIPGLSLVFPETETNMVYFDLADSGRSAAQVAEALLDRGVHIGVNGATTLRAVTHLDVSPEMVEQAAATLAEVLTETAEPDRVASL
jgi:threonine aldolase